VANGGSFSAFNGSVSAYRIADNGALTPVARSPFPAGISSSSVAVDLFGRFVYVANSGSNINSLKPGSVSAYRIAENGALTPVAGSPFLAGSSAPISVAVDLFGRLVYVANQASNNVSAYRIAENGVLTPAVGSPFPAGILPTSLAVDLLGEFVYVANQGNSSVSGSYNVSATALKTGS
jgi:6-phosphogluconolactonase